MSQELLLHIALALPAKRNKRASGTRITSQGLKKKRGGGAGALEPLHFYFGARNPTISLTRALIFLAEAPGAQRDFTQRPKPSVLKCNHWSDQIPLFLFYYGAVHFHAG